MLQSYNWNLYLNKSLYRFQLRMPSHILKHCKYAQINMAAELGLNLLEPMYN